MFGFVLIATLFVLFYGHVRHKYSYWSSRGIHGPVGNLFKFGNPLEEVFTSPDELELCYLKKYGKIVGTYRGLQPKLIQSYPELIKQMMGSIPYLEAVLKEVLHKYPPIIRQTRNIGIDFYKLNGKVPLSKELRVDIYTYAVHHNPEYYPEPDHIKPERFMPANKHLIMPYAYIPFGLGPRNCIGMRFALQEIRLCIAQLVLRFWFVPSANTRRMKFVHSLIMLNAQSFELKVERR